MTRLWPVHLAMERFGTSTLRGTRRGVMRRDGAWLPRNNVELREIAVGKAHAARCSLLFVTLPFVLVLQNALPVLLNDRLLPASEACSESIALNVAAEVRRRERLQLLLQHRRVMRLLLRDDPLSLFDTLRREIRRNLCLSSATYEGWVVAIVRVNRGMQKLRRA